MKNLFFTLFVGLTVSSLSLAQSIGGGSGGGNGRFFCVGVACFSVMNAIVELQEENRIVVSNRSIAKNPEEVSTVEVELTAIPKVGNLDELRQWLDKNAPKIQDPIRVPGAEGFFNKETGRYYLINHIGQVIVITATTYSDGEQWLKEIVSSFTCDHRGPEIKSIRFLDPVIIGPENEEDIRVGAVEFWARDDSGMYLEMPGYFELTPVDCEKRELGLFFLWLSEGTVAFETNREGFTRYVGYYKVPVTHSISEKYFVYRLRFQDVYMNGKGMEVERIEDRFEDRWKEIITPGEVYPGTNQSVLIVDYQNPLKTDYEPLEIKQLDIEYDHKKNEGALLFIADDDVSGLDPNIYVQLKNSMESKKGSFSLKLKKIETLEKTPRGVLFRAPFSLPAKWNPRGKYEVTSLSFRDRSGKHTHLYSKKHRNLESQRSDIYYRTHNGMFEPTFATDFKVMEIFVTLSLGEDRFYPSVTDLQFIQPKAKIPSLNGEPTSVEVEFEAHDRESGLDRSAGARITLMAIDPSKRSHSYSPAMGAQVINVTPIDGKENRYRGTFEITGEHSNLPSGQFFVRDFSVSDHSEKSYGPWINADEVSPENIQGLLYPFTEDFEVPTIELYK